MFEPLARCAEGMLEVENFHITVGTAFVSAESGEFGFVIVGQRMTWHLHVVGGRKPEARFSDITQQQWERIQWSMPLSAMSLLISAY